MKKLIFIILTFLCFGAKAQLKNVDAYFRKQSQIADSLTSRQLMGELNATDKKRNQNAAIKINLELSKQYKGIDYLNLLWTCIDAEHAEGFYISCKELIKLSGDSVNMLLDQYLDEAGKETCRKSPLLQMVAKLQKEEGPIIQYARTHLNWKWNSELPALFKSNVDFRYIEKEFFKDSTNYGEAMIFIDSTHLFEFCALVEKHGYPYTSNVGFKANGASVLLRHCVFLVGARADRKSCEPFIEKFKFLMPYVLNGVKNEGADYGFYQYLYGWLMERLEKRNFREDITYFKQFEYKI